jgi:hypothetical protein
MTLPQDPFWSLPGPSRWLEKVAYNAAANGMAGVVAPSEGGPPRLLEAVEAALRGSDFSSVLRVKSRRDRKPIVARLASVAGMAGASFRTLESLMEARETNGCVFLVERVDVDEWMLWATFLRLFRLERKRTQTALAPSIVAVLPVDLPRYDVVSALGETEISWSGRVSSFDMRVFVRNLLGDDDSILGRIREETIVELAGFDTAFAQSLTNASIEDIADSLSILRQWELPAMPPPTWANGYVDEVDGEPFEHTISVVSRSDWKLIERRLWRAHARVIMSVIADVRSRFYKKYCYALAANIPYVYDTPMGPKTIFDLHDLELSHLIRILSGQCTDQEHRFLKALNAARNAVAHFWPVEARFLIPLSTNWTAIRNSDRDNLWKWPRCGQRLIVLVGPAGAGKTTYAQRHHGADEVVSSDSLREELFGSRDFQGNQEAVFVELHNRVRDRLALGESAVVDATNLRQRDRLAIVDLAPSDIQVVYEVIDRPVETKLAQAGWRSPELINGHTAIFEGELENILAGDGRTNVVVRDLREVGVQSEVSAAAI